VSSGPISFDALARNIVERSGYRFTEAGSDAERDVAFRLRYQAVVDQGWTPEAGPMVGASHPEERPDAFPPTSSGLARDGGDRDGYGGTPLASDGRERDAYDDRSVHIVGWDGDSAIATGRIVLPPGPLPSEELCGIRIEPHGKVVEVGRMTVARSHQDPGHGLFVALLARLYLEVRARGYEVACGMMSPRARSLVRLLGLQLEILGEDRLYWGERRAPVRFQVTLNDAALTARWEPDGP
jgi:hypothetical protein